jgi:hypothetical protein
MFYIIDTLCLTELVTNDGVEQLSPCLGVFLEKLLIIQLSTQFHVYTELKHISTLQNPAIGLII